MAEQSSEQRVEEALKVAGLTAMADENISARGQRHALITLAAAVRDLTAENERLMLVVNACQRQLREHENQELRDNTLRQLAEEEAERADALTAERDRLREAGDALVERLIQQRGATVADFDYARTLELINAWRAALNPTEQAR